MRHIALALFLTACAAPVLPEPSDPTPVCGLDENLAEAPETSNPVGVISQAATTCPPRPPGHKLLSPECPTCPILRIYPYQSPLGIADMRAGCDIWNKALGWTVCTVDGTSRTSADTIPTYGVGAQENNNYNLPGDPCQGGWFTAGEWAKHHLGCSRDLIRVVPPSSCFPVAYARITFAHEIGHALFRGNTDNGTSIVESGHDVDHPDSVMSRPSVLSSRVTTEHKRYLNNLRSYVLEGWASLPCAHRQLCN